jgi:hypothetical protein
MIRQHIAQDSAIQRVVLPRRSFLTGLVGLIAAPAVIRAEALMPIKVWTPEREPWPIPQWQLWGFTEAEWNRAIALGVCID